MKLNTLTAPLTVFLLFTGGAHAAVNLAVNSPVADQHTITLDPVTFTATANSTFGAIVFEDFFAANNTNSGTNISSSLTGSIDGGPSFPINLVGNNGTFSFPIGSELDPNDLYMQLDPGSPIALTIGQQITISGSSVFTVAGIAPLNGAFGQTAVLTDPFPTLAPISNITSLVPEPSTALLLGLAALGLVARRRRSN